MTPENSLVLHTKSKRARSQGWNIAEYHGQWRARVSDPHNPGARESKSFDSKSDAVAWAVNKRANFQAGQATAKKTRFEDLVAEFLIAHGAKCRSALHKKTMAQTIDALREGGVTDLGADHAVAQVTRIIAGLKSARKVKTATPKPASPKTKINFLVRVNTLANWAVRRKHLLRNDFDTIELQKAPTRDKAVFNLEEIGKLLDPVHQDHPFYRPIACMLCTGFRQSEMRHMQWDWFLWDDARIALRMGENATMGHEDGEEDDVSSYTTKTGKERLTRLMDELAEIMKPDGEMTGPVFPDLIVLDGGTVQRRFDAYVKHCGVDIGRRTPHSCRHTWTCLMLASGENEILVQQYAGHDDKTMTKHYARQQDAYRRRIGQAGWERGELRLRDFSPGGAQWRDPAAVRAIAMPPR